MEDWAGRGSLLWFRGASMLMQMDKWSSFEGFDISGSEVVLHIYPPLAEIGFQISNLISIPSPLSRKASRQQNM